MTIERIHQEIKFRWNKLNSNHKKDFPAAYIDDAINKASEDYVEIFYSGNNSKQYKFGFEVTQQRTDLLQTLVVPADVAYTPTQVFPDQFSFDLSTLNEKYRHFLRAYIVPVECPSKKIPVAITRSNDLDTKLADANTQPSLLWNRCLGSIQGNTLRLYTKDYTILSLYIEYLTDPVKVFSGGYDSLEFLNGDTLAYQSGSPKVTSNLPNHDILVDMTVQYIASTLEDVNKFQLQEKQILTKV
jgi:hypothetical protein